MITKNMNLIWNVVLAFFVLVSEASFVVGQVSQPKVKIVWFFLSFFVSVFFVVMQQMSVSHPFNLDFYFIYFAELYALSERWNGWSS